MDRDEESRRPAARGAHPTSRSAVAMGPGCCSGGGLTKGDGVASASGPRVGCQRAGDRQDRSISRGGTVVVPVPTRLPCAAGGTAGHWIRLGRPIGRIQAKLRSQHVEGFVVACPAGVPGYVGRSRSGKGLVRDTANRSTSPTPLDRGLGDTEDHKPCCVHAVAHVFAVSRGAGECRRLCLFVRGSWSCCWCCLWLRVAAG